VTPTGLFRQIAAHGFQSKWVQHDASGDSGGVELAGMYSQRVAEAPCENLPPILSVGLPSMPQPTANVAATRVVVGPVQNTAFRIPLVFAVKLYRITFPQILDPRCQVDVLRDDLRGSRHQRFIQECLPRAQSQDEPLMSRSS